MHPVTILFRTMHRNMKLLVIVEVLLVWTKCSMAQGKV